MTFKKIAKTLIDYLFFLFSYFLLSKSLVLVFLLLGKVSKYNLGIFIFGTVFSVILLGVFIYFFRRLNLLKEIEGKKIPIQKRGLCILVSFGLLIAVSFLLSLISSAPGDQTNSLINILDTNRSMFIFYIIRTVFIVPIYEEVLFRGVLLCLEKQIMNKLKIEGKKKYSLLVSCILVNSVVFAYLHHSNSIISFCIFLVFGVISSCLFLYTKDLKTNIILHQLNNLFAIFC
ncbi:CPBP family intramembrane glutamic endopeptidase [Enterococcus alishanensis]